MNLKSIISQMTLEEKAGLLSGRNFWQTKAVERLGVPSMMVTDGPHGLRKQSGDPDHLGLMASVPATCFPTAAGLACSWDRDLLSRVGEALGEECRHQGVSVILGPGANIKRSPLCGRNFEYFSEDPVLSGEMASAHISGVQSKGVGTSLKHFAVNNQETRRMSVNAEVDMRTLREIYLASFERAVKQARPDTVMCSYNRLNGPYCSEHPWLLTTVLRDEWGFEGFVMSDWGAVNDRVSGLSAGMDLEMPTSHGVTDAQVVEAVRNGSLDEEIVDTAAERILNILFLRQQNGKPAASLDEEAHHALAREVAAECAVLLKNESGILPLVPGSRVAVIGGFARTPRYQGGGSSHVNPTHLDDAHEALSEMQGATCSYSQGYLLDSDEVDEVLIGEAVFAARNADVAILYVGLPERYESEGYDRKHMKMPPSHTALIEAVSAVQPKTVVVLSNGSPVEMPWAGGVAAIIEGYLGGQAWGGAMADILTGKVNPSGKLAETFPVKLADNPSYLFFPGEKDLVEYREGLYVGYRWYDAVDRDVQFPFGFGLSYTDFSIADLSVDKTVMNEMDSLNVSVQITNTGNRFGKEVVQIYVADKESTVRRPDKELKAFTKVALEPGESRTVSFTLTKRDFAYWNETLEDWHVESGTFEILVGNSSRSIHCRKEVDVTSDQPVPASFTMNSTVGDLLANPMTGKAIGEFLATAAGPGSPFADVEMENKEMMQAMLMDMPLRAMKMFTGQHLDWTPIEEMLKNTSK